MNVLNHTTAARGVCLLACLPVFQPSLAAVQGQCDIAAGKHITINSIDRYTQEIDRFTEQHAGRHRIFADVADGVKREPNRWREFKSEEDRAKADTGYNLNGNAYVWLKDGRVVFAHFTFQSPSRDWVHYIRYYFRADGTLAKLDAILNTFYGDVSIERRWHFGPSANLLRATEQIYRLGTREKTKRPAEFYDAPVPLYRTVTALPFYHLLKPRRATESF
jgi:hypothetical protein